MTNPILELLNQNNKKSSLQTQPPTQLEKINNLKESFNLLRNSQNPQMLLQQMSQTNPQLRQVMDYIRQNGGDAQAAFYKLAQQKGINPEEILKILR